MRDSNPRHPRCKGGDDSSDDDNRQRLTTTPNSDCTAACTSEAETAHGGPLAVERDGSLMTLAAALLNLDPLARAKLAALLLKADH